MFFQCMFVAVVEVFAVGLYFFNVSMMMCYLLLCHCLLLLLFAVGCVVLCVCLLCLLLLFGVGLWLFCLLRC